MIVAIVLGTRPEIIKMSPVIRACEKRGLDYFILHTGQHYSYNMDKVFFEQLELPEAKYNLDVGSGSQNERRCVVNGTLVEKLVGLIEKLKETKGMRIFKRGFDKAVELLEKSVENNVFVWAPRLKDWLRDPDYIFWLGAVR